MIMFRNAGGYAKPGLDALSREFDIAEEARDHHSALHDAELLMSICQTTMDLLLLLPPLDHSHIFTFHDILLHLNEKLPTLIWNVFNIARECSSHTDLEYKLYEFSKQRTALNHKQVSRIVRWYFKDRYLYCSKFVLMK